MGSGVWREEGVECEAELGLNLLGRALMDVRRILREEEQEEGEEEMKMDEEEENVMMDVH